MPDTLWVRLRRCARVQNYLTQCRRPGDRVLLSSRVVTYTGSFAGFLCGNGQVDTGETCDDGNPGTMMAVTKTVSPECGNGRLDGAEECDDGNRTNTDACTNECLDAICGDGIIQRDVEECDGGVWLSR